MARSVGGREDKAKIPVIKSRSRIQRLIHGGQSYVRNALSGNYWAISSISPSPHTLPPTTTFRNPYQKPSHKVATIGIGPVLTH